MKTTAEKVKDIILQLLLVDEDEVVPAADLFDDLGADSIDIVELVMTCEEDFDIEIPDDDVENIRTVQQIIDYVQKKVGSAVLA